MQFLKVLAIIVEKIARVKEIADGRKTKCLCRTMPAGVTKIFFIFSRKQAFPYHANFKERIFQNVVC